MRAALCCFGLLSMLFALPATAQPGKIVFRKATIDKIEYKYEVYVPAGWTKSKKWPVILFLHGTGERGGYEAGKDESVIARFFVTYHKSLPAIVVFPRCPEKKLWVNPEIERLALKALDQSMAEFHGDPARVYLTGLSMGGYGTWFIASRHARRFAAIAPVCPGVRELHSIEQPALSSAADPFAAVARRVKSLPIWIFHGADDPVIPVDESRKMFAALKAIGADVRYSEYPGVQHDSWNKAYAEPDFLSWLLSHTKKKTRRVK
jgi:predicted peptidase